MMSKQLLSVALMVLFVTTIVCARNQTVYHTSYGWDDNSPPSAQIAYPKSDGYPTKHNQAYEGTGTYADPITFATDKDELAIGSIVWVADLHKYFIMEDDCEACDSDWRHGKWHIDLWMGPGKALPANKLYACEDYITKSGVTIIIDPAQNLPVDKTPLINPSTADCTAVIYRN